MASEAGTIAFASIQIGSASETRKRPTLSRADAPGQNSPSSAVAEGLSVAVAAERVGGGPFGWAVAGAGGLSPHAAETARATAATATTQIVRTLECISVGQSPSIS